MKQKLTYLLLDTAFVGIILVLSFYIEVPKIHPTILFLMGTLAANRIGRTIAFNAVGEPFRGPFTKVVRHSSGAGDTVEPAAKHGPHRAIGELVSCPICAGTWGGLALLSSYLLREPFGTLLILTLGVAGGAEVINWLIEHLQWSSYKVREETGYWNRENKKYLRYSERNGEPVRVRVEK
jgi:hypothetical protein